MRNKVLFIFLYFISITLFSYSQDYPKRLVIDGIEIIGITPVQLSKINGVFVERDLYKEKSDSVEVLLNKYSYLNKLFDKNMDLKDSIINSKDNIINTKDFIINEQSFRISALSNKKKKLERRNKIYLGAGLTLGLIGILAIAIN